MNTENSSTEESCKVEPIEEEPKETIIHVKVTFKDDPKPKNEHGWACFIGTIIGLVLFFKMLFFLFSQR